MADASANRLYEPFYSLKTKGVGLGLTICNQIVHLHGGTISIESKKNKGTKVTVMLPIRRIVF